ncbi:tyrosine-protein phosphatase non-receptor type 13-like [Haliotis rubra]|uniref:tyrosine-protein phosphatase non-receptor type 13-like n=1 Tax=Haliotis rubra TaxID=36100 RepID=UPI001EE5D660|nr:tyrosine-protein phosphatase non-receptor type 13-like [Haliotis rubra]
MKHSAYQKYMRLKDRQRKLRALRQGKYGVDVSQEWSQGDGAESMSDTHSTVSLISCTLGSYMPGIHAQYGSEAALLMVDREKDSIFSTDLSFLIPDYKTRRAEEDLPVSNTLQSTVDTSKPRLNNQTKEFVGLEFSYRASKPLTKLTMPLQGESLKNPSLARRVVIIHLTGQKLESTVDPSTTGRQLFDAVIAHLGIVEFFFFGLSYVNESEHFFLEGDTKLHKVAPEGWRDWNKGCVSTITLTLHFRVKYYVDAVTDLRHLSSHHLLYLQLRHDVLEERALCTEEQAVCLAGLALQSEFGDQETLSRNYFVPEQYFPGHVIRRLGMGVVREKGLEAHRLNAGLPPTQSELEYIKKAMSLPEYGVHFHKLFKSKNDTSNLMYVGIASHHLVLAELHSHKRVIIQHHAWNSILKISFNKRRFSVQTKPDMAKSKPPKINLFSSSYRKGRYLLQFSTAQHRFQMRMRTRPSNIETLQGTDLNEEAGFMEDKDVMAITSQSASQQGSSVGSEASEDVRVLGPPAKYRSPPPYRPSLSFSLNDLRDVGPRFVQRGWASQVAASCVDVRQSPARHDSHGIDMIQHPTHPGTFSYQAVSEPDLDHSTVEARLSPQTHHGRQIFEVSLLKDENHGIGITIVGGESTSKLDLGIFVKSVTAGGPANKDGSIRPGDRLVAINGQSLEGVQHHEAVQMIRESDDLVSLLVSQVRAPMTLRRKVVSVEALTPACSTVHSLPTSGDVGRTDPFVDQAVCHSMDRDLRNIPPVKPPRRMNSDNQLTSDTHATAGTAWDTVTLQDEPVSGMSETTAAELAESILGTDREECILGTDGEECGVLMMDSNQWAVSKEEELEVLGDIADLAIIDDSSSDSDFDTALENAVKGRLTRKPSQNASNVPIRLQKHNGQSGITITGGSDSRFKDGAVYVISVSSSDKQTNSVVVGDQLLEINDVSVHGQTYGQVLELLHRAPSVCPLLVRRIAPSLAGSLPEVTPAMAHLPADISTDPYSFVTRGEIYEVELVKGASGLGFSFQGGEDLHPDNPSLCVPRIKKLFVIGPAAESGLTKPGDVILEVNGRPMRHLTRTGIMQAMRSSRSVRLKMCRPRPGDLPTIHCSDSEDSLISQLRMPVYYDKDGHSLFDSDFESDSEDEGNTPRPRFTRRSQASDSDSESTVSLTVAQTNQNLEQTDQIMEQTDKKLVQVDKKVGVTCHPVFGSEHLSGVVGHREDVINQKSLTRQEHVASDTEISEGDNAVKQVSGNKNVSEVEDVDDSLASVEELIAPTQEQITPTPEQITPTQEQITPTPEQITPTQVFEVTLCKRQRGGLGFTVAGGATTTGGCYIKGIVQDPALSDGRLRVGDKLIRVNSQDMSDMSHFEAVMHLRKAPQVVTIAVQRDDSDDDFLPIHVSSSQGEGQTDTSDEQSAAELQSCINTALSSEESLDERHPESAATEIVKPSQREPDDPSHRQGGGPETGVQKVELQKPATGGLGFSLVTAQKNQEMCVFVRTISDGGAAATDGRLQVGDRLLQVNGESLVGMNHVKAVKILRKAKPGPVEVTISRPGQMPSFTDAQSDVSDVAQTDANSWGKDFTDDSVNSAAFKEDSTHFMAHEEPTPCSDGGDNPGSDNTQKTNDITVLFDDSDYELITGDSHFIEIRKLPLTVPDMIKEDWLSSLPLMSMAEDDEDVILTLLQYLTDKVEQEDPLEEFMNLRHLQPTDESEEARLSFNRHKNRYRNVLPFDFNRVHLSGHEDFINASHVDVNIGDASLQYIACQGPLPHTTADFWNMVWQQRADVIGMLTLDVEAERVKCHRYWPESTDTPISVSDSLTVSLKSHQVLDNVHIRHIVLHEHKSKMMMNIAHLNFVAWPDHGVPDTALPVLQYLRLMHLYHHSAPPPPLQCWHWPNWYPHHDRCHP